MSPISFHANAWLPYGRHCIDEDDIAAVSEVLRSNWLTAGPVVEQFEEALAEAVGARYAVACSSGTAALHLLSLALGLGKGDKAIVPSMTFVATANAARFVGADVCLSDVDPATGLQTADDARVALANAGNGVKVLYTVHLNGQVTPLEAIGALTEQHNIVLIEDGCHALGTSYRTEDGETRMVGDCRFSKATVFSFHPVKTIAMGEGGAVTTNDAGLVQQIKCLRNHGIVRNPADWTEREQAFDADGVPNPWYYEMQSLGFNYRPSDIHCALGLSQLRKLRRFSERRRQLMQLYDDVLKELAPVVMPVKRVEDCMPVLHLYPVLIDFKAAGITRSVLMSELSAQGIGTQVHYIPIHRQPYYKNLYGSMNLPGADNYYSHALTLPLFPAMVDKDIEYIVSMLRKTPGI